MSAINSASGVPIRRLRRHSMTSASSKRRRLAIVAQAVDQQFQIDGLVVRDQKQRQTPLRRGHGSDAFRLSAVSLSGGTTCLAMFSTAAESALANAVMSGVRA